MQLDQNACVNKSNSFKKKNVFQYQSDKMKFN